MTVSDRIYLPQGWIEPDPRLRDDSDIEYIRVEALEKYINEQIAIRYPHSSGRGSSLLALREWLQSHGGRR